MRRRSFLTATAALGLCTTQPVRAIDPFVRSSPGRMRLSLAAYSMRKYLAETKTESEKMDLMSFVEYCHSLGLTGAELTSYYFPKDVDDNYIAQLKRLCHLRGISVSGGAIGNDFCKADPEKLQADIEHTKLWIDRYAKLGASVIRIFAGNQPQGEEWATTRQRCIDAIQQVCAYAETRGIYLALENHGGVTAKAEGLLEIVKGVQSSSFGVNLDSGNFRSTADPYAELEMIAPYAVNAQIKVDMYPNGKREATDIAKVLGILSKSNYHGWVALEYESDEEPKEAIPRYIRTIQELLKQYA